MVASIIMYSLSASLANSWKMLSRPGHPSDWAMMVATITPLATSNRAARPSTTRTPEDTPAAGQNTATPSAWRERKAQPRPKEIGQADRTGEPLTPQSETTFGYARVLGELTELDYAAYPPPQIDNLAKTRGNPTRVTLRC